MAASVKALNEMKMAASQRKAVFPCSAAMQYKVFLEETLKKSRSNERNFFVMS